MKYKIDSFWKAFVTCFVMICGFCYIFTLLFGMPTTVLAVVFMVVASGICFLLYLMWIKEEEDG